MYDEQPGEAGQLRYLLDQIEDRRADLEQRRQDVLAALAELDELERRCRAGPGPDCERLGRDPPEAGSDPLGEQLSRAQLEKSCTTYQVVPGLGGAEADVRVVAARTLARCAASAMNSATIWAAVTLPSPMFSAA